MDMSNFTVTEVFNIINGPILLNKDHNITQRGLVLMVIESHRCLTQFYEVLRSLLKDNQELGLSKLKVSLHNGVSVKSLTLRAVREPISIFSSVCRWEDAVEQLFPHRSWNCWEEDGGADIHAAAC